MSCTSEGILECNNWIALIIYIFLLVGGVLLALLCYGICRQMWLRWKDPSPPPDHMFPYKVDSEADMEYDAAAVDVGYMERNPHAQSDSEHENNGGGSAAVTARGTPSKKSQRSEDFLPPYAPPNRERHASTITNSSSTTPPLSTSRSTSSKPPLSSVGAGSEERARAQLQVEYSTTI